MDPAQIIVNVITFFVPFLFSLCFHEYAHGWMAKRLGDNTAEVMGRLTMNPMAHIDWLGTVALPIMAIVFPGVTLFGWAKPVPVVARNLRHPRKDMFWVALAGPMSNILLYIVGLVGIYFLSHQSGFTPGDQLIRMVHGFLHLNLVLAFFNLIPVHPLDGGKIVARFLPLQWDMKLESLQPQMSLVLLLLVIFGGLQILALPINWIFEQTVGFVVNL